jgi:cyanophycinase-like exopeptidase
VSPAAYALLGAGEFEPWHEDVDRWLLEQAHGDGSVLISPAAAAPEGDTMFDSWANKGLAHYERLGIPARVLPLKTRADADRADVIGMADEASVIFFSGGNPWYLASILAGSSLWERLRERLLDGLAYAGCSAGVACLTEMTYDSDTQDFETVFKPGLGYVRNALFAPHWDIVDTWIPGARGYITAAAPAGGVLVGLDEDTAMIGDGTAWTVHGRQAIHVFRSGSWTDHTDGTSFELALV